jgi:hypothetical protein
MAHEKRLLTLSKANFQLPLAVTLQVITIQKENF